MHVRECVCEYVHLCECTLMDVVARVFSAGRAAPGRREPGGPDEAQPGGAAPPLGQLPPEQRRDRAHQQPAVRHQGVGPLQPTAEPP